MSVLNTRRRDEFGESEPVEAPSADRVMRNLSKIPAAALGKAH